MIVDEISMIGWNTFHSVNTRLKEVTANYSHAFGALHINLSGDFKQLQSVNASPIYNGNRSLVQGPRTVAVVTPLPALSIYASERRSVLNRLNKNRQRTKI
jgi:hypothetical protein